MIKKIWKFITRTARKTMLKEINKLLEYEDELVELIENSVPPQKTAQIIIQKVQHILYSVVNKIF